MEQKQSSNCMGTIIFPLVIISYIVVLYHSILNLNDDRIYFQIIKWAHGDDMKIVCNKT